MHVCLFPHGSLQVVLAAWLELHLKKDRVKQTYGKISGGVSTWLRTCQTRRAMVQVCGTLGTEEASKEWLSLGFFSTKSVWYQMKCAGGRWEIKKLIRMFWEGSWFDFSQTFALSLDVYSISVLQCKVLVVPWDCLKNSVGKILSVQRITQITKHFLLPGTCCGRHLVILRGREPQILP